MSFSDQKLIFRKGLSISQKMTFVIGVAGFSCRMHYIFTPKTDDHFLVIVFCYVFFLPFLCFFALFFVYLGTIYTINKINKFLLNLNGGRGGKCEIWPRLCHALISPLLIIGIASQRHRVVTSLVSTSSHEKILRFIIHTAPEVGCQRDRNSS